MSDSKIISDAKKALRKSARETRATAHGARVAGAGELLARACMAVLAGKEPGIASAYHPFESEIDCLPLVDALRDKGWRIALPVVIEMGQPLEFRIWVPGDKLVPGSYDIPAPPEGAEVVRPDVLLVPMLAFDHCGYRLGYGGGFYDRTLALARSEREVTAIGLAYDAQWIDRCPIDHYDQPLDAIVTEAGAVALKPCEPEG